MTGTAANRSPITARAFLAALEADETAVPLPEHLCSLTFWLEAEVHEAWMARCAAHRHESGQPMEKWEVLALLMHNWWKTHENEETRRQRREHKTLERDGWRCKAPGCSSMGNGMLHEHHVIFKSRGGARSDPSNLITLCSAHHLSLLHNGYMRCYGEAPDEITWEMGLSEGREPFLIYHGDRLIGGTGVNGQRPRGDDDAAS